MRAKVCVLFTSLVWKCSNIGSRAIVMWPSNAILLVWLIPEANDKFLKQHWFHWLTVKNTSHILSQYTHIYTKVSQNSTYPDNRLWWFPIPFHSIAFHFLKPGLRPRQIGPPGSYPLRPIPPSSSTSLVGITVGRHCSSSWVWWGHLVCCLENRTIYLGREESWGRHWLFLVKLKCLRESQHRLLAAEPQKFHGANAHH